MKFLPGGSMGGDVITARLRRLNFPYTLPNAIFYVCFLSFSIYGSELRPKLKLRSNRAEDEVQRSNANAFNVNSANYSWNDVHEFFLLKVRSLKIL